MQNLIVNWNIDDSEGQQAVHQWLDDPRESASGLLAGHRLIAVSTLDTVYLFNEDIAGTCVVNQAAVFVSKVTTHQCLLTSSLADNTFITWRELH